jgi:iron transport multicopper oxidase
MVNTANPNSIPPLPASVLLNDGTAAVNWNFDPTKSYRIRIINFAALISVLFQFDSHTMRVIEIDGVNVVKKDAAQIRLGPAQRYSILLDPIPGATRKNYGFLASFDVNRDFTQPGAIYPLNLTGNLVYYPSLPLPSMYVVPSWNPIDDMSLFPSDNMALLPSPSKTILLNFNFGTDSLGIPRYDVFILLNILMLISKLPGRT